MSLRRARILFAAVVSSSMLACLAVAESGSATTPVTVTDSSTAIAAPITESSEPISGRVAESSVAATPEDAAVEILPPDEPWAGLTRSEWEVRAWQWEVSMPVDVSPSIDTTGERCGYGQSGPVFFLAGNFGPGSVEGIRRTCVIAEGTAIYVNVVGTECSTVEPPPFFGRTEDELRACANASLDRDVTEFEARINGQAVADLEAYRIGSPLFTLTFPENNLFGVEPGVAQAVSESYSFIILPPPLGEYEITSKVRTAGQSEPFALTFNLVVEAPQVIEPPTT